MSRKRLRLFERTAKFVLLGLALLSIIFSPIPLTRDSSPKTSFISIDIRSPQSLSTSFAVNQYDNLIVYVTSEKGLDLKIDVGDSFKLISQRKIDLPDILYEDCENIKQGTRFEYCLVPVKAGNNKINLLILDQQKYSIDVTVKGSLFNDTAYASSQDTKPVVGVLKPLVLLVDFPDFKANYEISTPQFFQDILFEEGDRSLYDFYYENSYGKLQVRGEVFNKWITVSKNYSYYEGGYRGMGFYPNNSQKLVEEAINSIDSVVNFADYDGNGDGVVDGIFVVYAGQRPATKNPNRIYPHQWNITPVIKDSKTISNYTIIPEYRSKPGDTTIGVFCHEFGHMIGGIDLYDLDGLVTQSFDGKKSYGIGKWSVMAYGTYGTLDIFGDSPAEFDPWHKIKFGWLKPVEIKEDALNVEISPVEMNNARVIKIVSPSNPKEYFLIEYRKKIGFDVSLPGEGILVYHVDEGMNSDNFAWLPGENYENHYLVSLIQADGKWDLEKCKNLGDKGDPFDCLLDFLSSLEFYNGESAGFRIENAQLFESSLMCDFLKIE